MKLSYIVFIVLAVCLITIAQADDPHSYDGQYIVGTPVISGTPTSTNIYNYSGEGVAAAMAMTGHSANWSEKWQGSFSKAEYRNSTGYAVGISRMFNGMLFTGKLSTEGSTTSHVVSVNFKFP